MYLAFQFFLFSLYAALISTLISTVILYFKLTNMALKNTKGYNDFKLFNSARYIWIVGKNSTLKLMLNKLLYFVPGHAVMLNGAFIFIALTHRGSYGIIKGIIASETLSFIPLVKYKIKPV